MKIGSFEINSVVCSDWMEFLRQLPDESVQCCVTSPPYWGLRDYGTATWEGGDEGCEHETDGRWYTESTAATSSAGAFSEPGEANKERLKKGRWREQGTCTKCGARRIDQQLGLERTPEEYVAKMVEGFREVRRVLRKDGVLFLNLGDSYWGSGKGLNGDGSHSSEHSPTDKQFTNKGSLKTKQGDYKAVGREVGIKPKDLCGIPWMVAFALRADGWWLRSEIIWFKKNPMPESVTDRPTKAHEQIFLLTKSADYFYDAEAIKEWTTEGAAHDRGNGINPKAKATGQNSRQLVDRDPTHLAAKRPKQNESFSGAVNEVVARRNKRSVWEINTYAFPEAHFATFPPELPKTCILAGTSEKGYCPKCGAPWERVVSEPQGGSIGQSWHDHSSDAEKGNPKAKGAEWWKTYQAGTTLGWQPTCTCNAGEPAPCVVLDPFSGAGTVKLVALELGRSFIGCELNPDYIAIGNRRTWSAENGGMKPASEDQPHLFEATL